MTKKTRLIPYDHMKYLAGAQPVFRGSEKAKIIAVYEGVILPEYQYLIVFLEDSLINHCYAMEGALAFEQELEEKTFYVNVYPTGVGGSTYARLELACEFQRLSENFLGTLKVTYTEEDLIK